MSRYLNKELLSLIVGKPILSVKIIKEDKGEYQEDVDTIVIELEDGFILKLSDEGQSCCEERYITCDDNLSDLIGSKFTGIRELSTTDEIGEEDYGSHEIIFIEIRAEDTVCTVCTHNVHNGYYGGFDLNIQINKKD
jgi:hypothetical protein